MLFQKLFHYQNPLFTAIKVILMIWEQSIDEFPSTCWLRSTPHELFIFLHIVESWKVFNKLRKSLKTLRDGKLCTKLSSSDHFDCISTREYNNSEESYEKVSLVVYKVFVAWDLRISFHNRFVCSIKFLFQLQAFKFVKNLCKVYKLQWQFLSFQLKLKISLVKVVIVTFCLSLGNNEHLC